ncbi:MAG: 50S ribosomal protein L25 [Patescibacteria group bacterium]
MTLTLTAKSRNTSEKLPAGWLRGVIYGHGLPTQSIEVPKPEFLKLFKQVKHSSLFDMTIEGAGAVKALVHDIQVNPVNMDVIHVDFRQIRMDEKITVSVSLVFVGESVAVKGLGGTLVKSIDELEVECLPANLPKEIVVDLSPLNTFDDQITVGSIKLPEGVVATKGANEVIATVEAPLTEDQIKKMEEAALGDVTAVKTEAEEKKEAEAVEGEEAAKAAEEPKK